ncbi:unnamed protein product [Ilex paraguariensis]|uniref:Uncharacterized protein n=1 Tax=Ilex paraguariensis TaxID=185542 RepID=A0ABC8TGY6_9AQUA
MLSGGEKGTKKAPNKAALGTKIQAPWLGTSKDAASEALGAGSRRGTQGVGRHARRGDAGERRGVGVHEQGRRDRWCITDVGHEQAGCRGCQGGRVLLLIQ